ncbi:MAG: VOC family protein [Thermoplasmata archaeon]|nr:VOC family protein [Thermoplasmata archaeon]
MPMWLYSTAVVVSDRKKALRWYCDVLGFSVLDDDPEHWTTVGHRELGARLHLCEAGSKGFRRRTGLPANSGILLLTKEPLPRLYRRLANRGVRFTLPPKEVPWGWISKFVDPDGNEFWLMPAPK